MLGGSWGGLYTYIQDFDTVQFISHVKPIVNLVSFIRDPPTALTTGLLL